MFLFFLIKYSFVLFLKLYQVFLDHIFYFDFSSRYFILICFIYFITGDVSSCVIDLVLLGFDNILIRVGLSIMDLLENKLLLMDLENLQLNFKRLVN